MVLAVPRARQRVRLHDRRSHRDSGGANCSGTPCKNNTIRTQHRAYSNYYHGCATGPAANVTWNQRLAPRRITARRQAVQPRSGRLRFVSRVYAGAEGQSDGVRSHGQQLHGRGSGSAGPRHLDPIASASSDSRASTARTPISTAAIDAVRPRSPRRPGQRSPRGAAGAGCAARQYDKEEVTTVPAVWRHDGPALLTSTFDHLHRPEQRLETAGPPQDPGPSSRCET
jgi:hypothetical protein